MNTQFPQKNRLAGFSLVELAIVLLITTIILSAGLSLLTVKREASQREATQKKQEVIKQALINYLGQNKRLPCPAAISTIPPYTTGAESRTAGNPCTQYSGIVPYQDLGLDQTAVLDGWENFITYVVSPPVITSALTQPALPAPLLTTAWLYSYNAITPSSTSPFTKTITFTPTNPGTPPNDAAFWPSTSTGGIIVAPTMGGTIAPITPLIADPAKATGAAVVLISHGKNGYGAYNIKGGINLPLPAANTDELQNANPLAVANQPTVVKRDTTDSITLVVGGTTYNNTGAFDDIVMPLSAYDLIGPLVTNGTLQSNAQQALSQANDIIVGKIVATKSCSTPTCNSTAINGSVCTSNCTAYDTNTPPNCIAYTPVCTPTTVCTQYSSVCSYTLPLSYTFTSPPNLTAWGVSYQSLTSPINSNTSSTLVAYILTSGNGELKSVSVGELQGTLARAAGFN